MSQAPRDEPDTPEQAEPAPNAVFADSMAAAARRAGFSPAAEGADET